MIIKNRRIIFLLSVGLCFFYSNSVFGNPLKALSQIKAMFVFNFANYVTWPKSAFNNDQDPIKVCLFGELDFAPFLKQFNGVLIENHPFNITQTINLDDIKTGCHILFVSEQQKIRLPDFWKRIEYIYVLSVGEKQEFANKGGIISIFRTADQMQFDINLANAMSNGLRLDSDLLSLARHISYDKFEPEN